MDNIPLMQLECVSRGFETPTARVDILKDADFSIERGESIAVVGASGIGKSTLLNLVGTLDRPDSGRVLYEGQDLLSQGDEKLAGFRNRHIGFVFQFHYLLQGFSALENVMMPGLIGKENRKKVEQKALSMLDRVGLNPRAKNPVEGLSGGEQQRVALARALIQKPRFLLADEPTGNLDQKTGQEMHKLLKTLNTEFDMTLMVVTHNPHLAELMERRVTIRENRIASV